MGRSNTLPISRPHQQDNGHVKPVSRSTTTQIQPQSSSSSKHHIKLPHVHVPFTHHNGPSTTSSTSPQPPRPSGPNRQNSVQTRYMNMLLAMDTIPRFHNILIAFFTWILL